jgi:hypothetical protein
VKDLSSAEHSTNYKIFHASIEERNNQVLLLSYLPSSIIQIYQYDRSYLPMIRAPAEEACLSLRRASSKSHRSRCTLLHLGRRLRRLARPRPCRSWQRCTARRHHHHCHSTLPPLPPPTPAPRPLPPPPPRVRLELEPPLLAPLPPVSRSLPLLVRRLTSPTSPGERRTIKNELW